MLREGVKVGVVTVTYNSEQVLPDFFRSLWAQTHENFVLYAVDNASKDLSIELLERERDLRLRVVANKENLGVAEGNNIGVRQALEEGCNAVLLLNNDVVFQPDLISKLLAALGTEGSNMISPKTTYFEPDGELWWAGGYFQKLLGWRTTHRGYQEFDRGQYEEAAVVSYAPTCCVLVDRSVFETIGCFDASYFVYYDDTDFMFRAYRNGFRLLYVPDPVLRHKVSSLTGGESPFSIRHMTRNRIYFWRKHFGAVPALAGAATLSFIFLIRVILMRASLATLWIQIKALREGFEMYLRATRPQTTA